MNPPVPVDCALNKENNICSFCVTLMQVNYFSM